jgi:hypothetical protein
MNSPHDIGCQPPGRFRPTEALRVLFCARWWGSTHILTPEFTLSRLLVALAFFRLAIA